MALNPLFKRSDIAIREITELVQSGQTVSMVMPLSLQMLDNSWWTLPYEPLISITGEVILIKRNVAKGQGRGTIKERWAEGDYQITIEGTFVNADRMKYPTVEVQKLREAVTQRRPISVQNELLQLLNISQIVVENYKLPFSKGENVQNYILDALSDDSYNLFIEVK